VLPADELGLAEAHHNTSAALRTAAHAEAASDTSGGGAARPAAAMHGAAQWSEGAQELPRGFADEVATLQGLLAATQQRLTALVRHDASGSQDPARANGES
jgi:hypothetical protein